MWCIGSEPVEEAVKTAETWESSEVPGPKGVNKRDGIERQRVNESSGYETVKH